MSKYSDKYKDPRWQKKRLEIFERDKWTCSSCVDDSATLHVHHKIYLPKREPWDYPNELLITLCERCHESETNDMPIAEKFICESLKRNFLSNDLMRMAEEIQTMELLHTSEVVASVYGWAFRDPSVQRRLIDLYFQKLEEDRENRG